jgi:hypothetical protein
MVQILILVFMLCAFPSAVWADFALAAKAYAEGDFATALGEYKQLAQSGDAQAQFNLGNMYRKGEGAAANMGFAAGYYRQAAERGHAKAQNSLGVLYASGKGVEPNDIEAFAWFSVAANQGDPEARKNAQFARSLLSKSRIASGELLAGQYYNLYVAPLRRPE